MNAKEVNGYDKSIDERPKFDVEAAKKLLAEAGYPNGFEVGMDCPNDRYINDEPICQAVVSMLARAGIKANLFAQTRGKFFQKINAPNFQTSFFMLARRARRRAQHAAEPIASRDPAKQQGMFNNGGYSKQARRRAHRHDPHRDRQGEAAEAHQRGARRSTATRPATSRSTSRCWSGRRRPASRSCSSRTPPFRSAT